MNGTEIMALYEAKKAKRVFLYRNGYRNAEAKCMVLNEKYVRDFGTFLSRVTSGLRAPVAIRNIYTPREGHLINNLKDLEANHYYVAGGSEQFKKVGYGSKKRESQLQRKRITFNDSTFHKATTCSRYKLPPNRPIIIHIYRNGDALSGKRVLIPSNIARSRDHVLELVTNKVQLFTPAKRLCSLDGKPVEINEIENGGKYVAMEGSKTFQRVSYSIVGDRVSVLPRKTFIKAPGLRPPMRAEKLKRKSGPSVRGDVLGLDQGPYTQPQLLKRKRSIRPMAGRKNKEGREKAINDLKLGEDSIYGGSPVQFLDESFRTENPLSAVYSEVTTAPAAISEEFKQDFTDSSHLEATSSRQSQPQTDSSTRQADANKAEQSKPSVATAAGSSTPRGARATKYSNAETRYRTEYSQSRQRSLVASKDEPRESPRETGGVSRSEKGIFYASNANQYVTAEYADDDQGNAFKAKDKRTEVVGAEMIHEGQETEVDQPIDHLKAETVEEEEEEEEEGEEDISGAGKIDQAMQEVRDTEVQDELVQNGQEEEEKDLKKEDNIEPPIEEEVKDDSDEEKAEAIHEVEPQAPDSKSSEELENGANNSEEQVIEEQVIGEQVIGEQVIETQVIKTGVEDHPTEDTLPIGENEAEPHFESSNDLVAAKQTDEETEFEPETNDVPSIQVSQELQDEKLEDRGSKQDLSQSDEKIRQNESQNSSRAHVTETTQDSSSMLQVPTGSLQTPPPTISSPQE